MNIVCRCPWVDSTKPDYVAYHDLEWGVPVFDDRRQFEFLILESAQAGLSWYTVLRKRTAYQKAFADFDPECVARFGPDTIAEMMENSGLIRNRAKLEAAVQNARCFVEIQEKLGSFTDYIWSFVEGRPKINHLNSLADYPVLSPESEALSRDLKQRGFRFVGPTICYAHMQATGLVNDHTVNCFRRAEIIAGYPPERRSL